MSFLRRLFRRRRSTAPIFEDEAYARLHGDRTGEIFRVVAVERKPIPRRTGDLSGELLRRAFEARLDARTTAAEGRRRPAVHSNG
jgi:hypothetical protein